MSRFLSLLLIVALPATAGCHKKMAQGPVSAFVQVAPMPPAAPRAAAEAQLQAHFEKVFFASDSSQIDAQGKAALADAAKVMLANPSLNVQVQGHCDERGTLDYNQALGQRRAHAIRNELVAGGVTPSRVSMLSYGEERPAMAGRSESAWSANRRGELVPLWNGAVASAD